MILERVLRVGPSLCVVTQKVRTLRPECREEPADVEVVYTLLDIDGVPQDVKANRALVERVLTEGR